MRLGVPVVVLFFLTVAVFLGLRKPPESPVQTTPSAQSSEQAVRFAGSGEPAPPARPALDDLGRTGPSLPLVTDSEQARVYRERKEFERDLRLYFEHADAWSHEHRDAEAERLRTQVEHYEADGGFSAGEAAMLKLALLRSLEPEPGDYQQEIEALLAGYLLHYEQRMHELETNPPAAFVEYKERERAIVEEVMAGGPVPDGLTREEYLRRRLQQERERLFTPP